MSRLITRISRILAMAALLAFGSINTALLPMAQGRGAHGDLDTVMSAQRHRK